MAYDKNKIADLITTEDPLKRNRYLKNTISLLEHLPNQNLVLNLDGDWGSGKTVFCQQLNYLIQEENVKEKNIIFGEETTNISKIYKTFYFDAWMNDIYKEPMQALLSELLVKFSKDLTLDKEIKQLIMELAIPMAKTSLFQGVSNLVTKVSGGAINLRELQEAYTQLLEESDGSSLIDSIISVDEKRDRIHSLIKDIRGPQKLLIIIDELDRCKPSFAVEFLELIKHFFDEENTIFLVATNKRELSHTVRKYYGESFNGYSYLSRFFDMELTLPLVSKTDYIKHKFSSVFQQTNLITSIEHTTKHFNFQLRDINRLSIPFQIFNNQFFRSLNEGQVKNRSTQAEVYIPYMVALKIKNGHLYSEFTNGKGYEDFKQYIGTHPFYENYSEIDTEWKEIYDFIVKTYSNSRYTHDIFTQNNTELIRIKPVLEKIFDALTMIGIEENPESRNRISFLE
ncbi:MULTISPECIES: KAP family P-loop NTPase fold protein [Lactococcus]|uniref:KAP family P-loop NTPase fold protein n=1 Tax=Lactococcus TaxID=1357 RepID=UPI001BCB520E|nr:MULTISPECIES: P-loop NTPase fold protein [Lactococcus]MBS4465027.1 hypothetical protein [Lactococcus garvieae]